MSLRGFYSSNIPSGSAQGFANANIVAFGNSLTYGQGTSDPATKAWPAVLKTLSPFNVPGCTITNVGVSGRTTQQLITEQASVVNPLFVPGKRNIVTVFEMINDLYNNCLNAAQAHANLVTLCNNLRAAGWEVWVGGTTARQVSIAPGNSCGSTPAQLEAESDAANALVAANNQNYSDGYFDLRSNSLLTNPATMATYMADNIHFNDAGNVILADILKTYLTAA